MYESGLLIAFLHWCVSTVWIVIVLNSQMSRNLRKIGMRLSWSTLLPVPLTQKDRRRGVLSSVALFSLFSIAKLFTVLFSWLYVAGVAAVMAYAWFKQHGRPQEIREFQWKLRNLDMSFDDIAAGMHKLQTSLGMVPTSYENFRADLWNSAHGDR